LRLRLVGSVHSDLRIKQRKNNASQRLADTPHRVRDAREPPRSSWASKTERPKTKQPNHSTKKAKYVPIF